MYTYIFPKLLPHIGMGLFQGLFSIQLIILERGGGGGGVERVLFQNTETRGIPVALIWKYQPPLPSHTHYFSFMFKVMVTSNDILKFCYDQIFDIHFFTFS